MFFATSSIARHQSVVTHLGFISISVQVFTIQFEPKWHVWQVSEWLCLSTNRPVFFRSRWLSSVGQQPTDLLWHCSLEPGHENVQQPFTFGSFCSFVQKTHMDLKPNSLPPLFCDACSCSTPFLMAFNKRSSWWQFCAPGWNMSANVLSGRGECLP